MVYGDQILAVKEISPGVDLGRRCTSRGRCTCVCRLLSMRRWCSSVATWSTSRRHSRYAGSIRTSLCPIHRLSHGFFDKYDCALQRATGRPVRRKFDLGTMTWLDGSGPIDVHINLPNATYPRVSAYDYGPHIG